MDFFEQQDVARRNTGRLIFLFATAVAAIVLMIYVLVMLVLVLQLESRYTSFWQPRVFVNTAVAVLTLITVGSLWKIRQLGKGGAAIAQRVGGRRLDPASTDPLERRVLNVVEEMAIAAGTPVPPVYVLDGERGLNAFAAGRTPADAVIGVTHGALQVLDRDELQGVVAHEFSHVLHGDSELNLQLIGVIHGIEVIGLAGRMILQGSGRRARSKKRGGAPIAVGAALMLIGAIGSFFGNLIRAAVSKQREFLADAAAVQFTRNPAGVAGALKKIGGFGFGSHLAHPGRAEFSHMFFGAGVPKWDLTQMFSTHPPLEERIRRVDPSFDGKFAVVPLEFVSSWRGEEAAAPASAPDRAAAVARFTAGAFGTSARRPEAEALAALAGLGRPEETLLPELEAALAARRMAGRAALRPRPLLARLGEPGPEHIAYAQRLMAGLAPALRAAAHEPEGARALSYALLSAQDSSVRDAQDRRVEEAEGPETVDKVRALRGELGRGGREARLPISEVLVGTLKALPPERYQAFRSLVRQLVEEDGRMELSEWVLAGFLLHRLDGHFRARRPSRARYSRITGLSSEITFLLSALAHAANSDPTRARAAFDAAARELDFRGAQPADPERCTPRVVEASLTTLAELAPRLKKRLLSACAASIAADEEVTPAEAELFSVVADWLDCPAPPLLPGQRLA
jgi:Zn-dependent protease with chaperone function